MSDEVYEIIATYTGASGQPIYGGRGAPPAAIPSWVPPAGYFADVPMVNSIQDIAASTAIYSASELNTNFTHWTGSAFLKNYGGPLGSQVYKGAGHETSDGQANIQSVVTCNFNTLEWEVSNIPNQRNASNSFNTFTGRAPDGTPYNGHTYLGLQSWPADWGTGGDDNLLMNFFCAGSGQNNTIYAIDITQPRNGYTPLVTTQPQNGVPEKISFRDNGAYSGGSYPITVQDNKRKGWHMATNGDIQFNLFLDSATMVITQVPSVIGNGSSAALVLCDSLDLLIGIDGGYSAGPYASNAHRTLSIRNLVTNEMTSSLTLGEVPTLSQGYDGADLNFKNPDVMGLEWVEELGAIFGLDPNGDPAGPRICKLTPPANNPATGQWTWSYIPVQHWPSDVGGASVLLMSENSTWSKFRWIPSLHAFCYCTSINAKPQVVRI